MGALIAVYGTFALLSLLGMVGNERSAEDRMTTEKRERVQALRKPFWRLLHTAHFILFVVAALLISRWNA